MQILIHYYNSIEKKVVPKLKEDFDVPVLIDLDRHLVYCCSTSWFLFEIHYYSVINSFPFCLVICLIFHYVFNLIILSLQNWLIKLVDSEHTKSTRVWRKRYWVRFHNQTVQMKWSHSGTGTVTVRTDHEDTWAGHAKF